MNQYILITFGFNLNVINDDKSHINKKLCISLYKLVFSGRQTEGQLFQYKSEVTHPISRNLFPHVLDTILPIKASLRPGTPAPKRQHIPTGPSQMSTKAPITGS